jgi:DNA-binding GntR family transcriptional regulator
MCLEAQHLGIWNAIKNRQPQKALEISREHIEYVKVSMAASAKEFERMQSAIRRKG